MRQNRFDWIRELLLAIAFMSAPDAFAELRR